MRRPLHSLIERSQRSTDSAQSRRSESGDTLIEVLLAIVVLGLASVAILLAFATTISGSAEHRNLTTMDTVLRTSAEQAISQIQQASSEQWGNCSPNPTDTSNVTLTPLAGSGYTAAISSVTYWNSTASNFTGSCVQSTTLSPQVNSPQLVQVTVTNTSTGTNGSISFVVSDPQARAVPSPGTETHLAFLSPVAGTSFQAGTNFPIDSQPVVAVEDANNEIVTSDGLPPITLALNPPAGSSGASLSNCAASVYAGVVTFSNCSVNVAGMGYTLTATDSLLTQSGDSPSVASAPFNVTAAAASQFSITSSPVSGPASASAAVGPITVQEQDMFGNPSNSAETVNLSSNSTGTAVFSATPGGAPITSISIPAGSSSASFYYGDTAAGTPTITVSGALTSDTQSEVITGGTATQLAFTTSPSTSTVAGTSFHTQPVVTAYDAWGNVATPDSSTVTLSVTLGTGTSGATVSGCSETESLGVLSFTGCSVNTAGTGYTLTAQDGTLTAATSGAFSITAGQPSQFAIISNPVSGVASSSATIGPITVQEQDAFGNPTTSFESVNLSSNSTGTARFAASSGGTGVTHVSIFAGSSTATFYYGDTKAGLPTITASGALVSDTQFETITGGAATHLVFTPATPGPGTAGSAIPNVVVQALDTFGNVATSTNSGSVVMSIATGPGTFTSLPTTVGMSNGVATFSNLQVAIAGTYTFTATPSGITGVASAVNSNSFTVSPATAATFTLSTPSAPAAGTAFNETITAKDSFGNTATGYTGAQAITFSGPANSPNNTAPTYPATVNFTAGVGTASITLVDAQTTTLTATQGTVTGVSGSFSVSQLAATKFAVPTPGTQTANTPFNETLTATDTYGNTVATYTGAKTIVFTGPASSPNATAPTYPSGMLTFAAGVTTASIKLVDAQSTTLTATQGTITGTSGSFTVNPTTAATFTLPTPATQTAGNAFSETITAKDALGNVATGYTGAQTITFSGPANSPNNTAPTYPATVSFTAGVGTASGITLVDAQSTTLTATQSTITGTSGSFTVNPITANAFTVATPATQTAGTSFNDTLTAIDTYGNTATSYANTKTVNFSGPLNSPLNNAPTYPGSVSFTAGVGTASGITLVDAQSTTLTATQGSITGTSGSFTVSSVAPQSVALASGGGSVSNGDAATIVMSQQINASTLCAGWNNFTTTQTTNATLTLTNVSNNDTLSVTATSSCSGNWNFGTVATGGNYVSGTTTTFNGTVKWNLNTDTLTFTFGTNITGSSNIQTGVTAGNPGYTAVTNMKDMFGNTVSTTLFTSGSTSRF